MFIHFLCPDAGFSTLAQRTLGSEEFFVVGESCAVETLTETLPCAAETLACFQALSPAWGRAGTKSLPIENRSIEVGKVTV